MKGWMKQNAKATLFMQGSYTVEAAFIIPISLGILFALLYYLYYEHDKVVLVGNVQYATLQMASSEEADMPDAMSWREQMAQGLWMGQVKSGKVKSGVKTVTGKGKATFCLNIPVMNQFLKSKQSVTVSKKMTTLHPETYLRWKKRES